MASTKIKQSVGFIGAGQMARALAGGLVRAGLVAGEHIAAADPDQSARQQLQEAVPAARIHPSNAEVVDSSDAIILAVKPQHIAGVMQQLAETPKTGKLFVSIAAGVTLARLADGLNTDRVVRVMPNTPCLVGRGAAAFALAEGATDEDGRLVAAMLEAVGIACQAPEHLLDAVTGLSGSGPAFVYTVIEALTDGGVRMGLPRDMASQLATQTVWGAAELVLTSGEHPAVLRDRVTSPGGTTVAGLKALEEGRLRATLMAAVEAATQRSQELGRTTH